MNLIILGGYSAGRIFYDFFSIARNLEGLIELLSDRLEIILNDLKSLESKLKNMLVYMSIVS